MSPDAIIDALRGGLDSILHVEWLSTAITVIVVAVVTIIASHLVVKVMRKLLKLDVNPLPALSIFVNIGRVTVWIIGICVILSSCFNVNVSAAIAAMGVGGIAISLGFQNTLSNLIGGLQISLAKLIEPGDHIQVGSNEGVVHDITWRHTSIITPEGDAVIVPNSVINSEALVKLKRDTDIRISIMVTPNDRALDHVATEMEQAVDAAITKITVLEDPAKISFTEVTPTGYKGILYFTVVPGVKAAKLKNAALRAIGNYAKAAPGPSELETPMDVFEGGEPSERERKHHRLTRRDRRRMRREQRRAAERAKRSGSRPGAGS